MIDFEAAADALSQASDSTVSRVSKTVRVLMGLLEAKKSLEADLKQTNEAIRKIEEMDLPAILSEAGLRKIETQDGTTVTVNPFYAASIPKTRQDEAFEWLRVHGYGDLVKNEVTVVFGRQEDEEAVELLNKLTTDYGNVTHKQKVEPMTLKAWVKETLENGKELPEELFGVFTGNKATLKQKAK